MKIRKICLCGMILIVCNLCLHATGDSKEEDGLGIPISRNDFELLLDRQIELLSSSHKIKTQEYIDLVRTDNLINCFDEKNRSAKERKFKSLFNDGKYQETIDALEAEFAAGSSYYSKKYDLHFGGFMNSNSIYKIVP